MKVKSKKKTKKKSSVRSSKIDLRDISLVKNILFKPDRHKYVRKQEVVEGCVFCNSARSVSLETLCVFQSRHSMVVLNKFPYNSGHLLVLPKKHQDNILKMSSEEYSDLMDTLKLAYQAVTDVYAPAAFNMGMNHGSSAGAGIPEHLHFHIIPRWAGDLNFFPLIAQTKVVIETLEQTYRNYMGYFSSRTK